MLRKTLLDILKEEKCWFEFKHLSDLGEEERLDKMRRAFEAALSYNDDDSAASIVHHLVAAADDVDDPSGFLDSPTSRASQEAVRILTGMEPETERRVYSRNGYRLFPLTRKSLIGIVVKRWSLVEDEDVSDSLFDFLCRLRPRDGAEHNVIEALVRENTGSEFQYVRAIRQHQRLLRSGGSVSYHQGAGSAIAKMLSLAWARNATQNEKERVFAAVLPLSGVTDAGAYEALATFSGWLANRTDGLKLLKESLAAVSGVKSVRTSFSFSDDVSEKHPEPGQFVVGCTVRVTLHGFEGGDEVEEVDDHEHLIRDYFPELHECVIAWQESERGFRPVKLVVNSHFPARPGQKDAKSVTVRSWYE